jgi:hypothetical protein
MLAIIRLAPEDWRQRAKRARTGKGLGCRDEQNRGGIKLRQPDQRSVVCLQLRIERESAVPSERLMFRLVCFPFGERPRGSLADSRNCAGGTPTQIPLDGIRTHEHRRTQTANRVPTASYGLRKAEAYARRIPRSVARDPPPAPITFDRRGVPNLTPPVFVIPLRRPPPPLWPSTSHR